ncbi:hypothetical protein LEP1GSC050_3192 [Leptospira broomii serovar Hurstbridge str. 5399]|uniref:Uncharacterized protein n=1 Tax=Leptospira broomii serovar Hurstbridge str. 5399 TaxID=1049789 RepID=T0FE78_9LEPT|nr:hypothetical protein LEP1GSC050_3192 [Leptospira broomii serovar Hurstbridge str. 5399]
MADSGFDPEPPNQGHYTRAVLGVREPDMSLQIPLHQLRDISWNE